MCVCECVSVCLCVCAVLPVVSVAEQSDRESLSVGPGGAGCASDRRIWIRRTGSAHVFAHFLLFYSAACPALDAGCNTSPRQQHTSDGQTMDSLGSRCKIVVVGDTQCGKTALLHVFAKDCYPEVGLTET